MICGIYKIQSKIKPDRIYIGSAVKFAARRRSHWHKLLKKCHHSSKLQNHVNKYGIKDLDFIIIEQFEFISKEHLLLREQYFLDFYKPWFNISPTAGNSLGIKRSEEFKQKCRERVYNESNFLGCRKGTHPESPMKGKHHTKESNEKNRQTHIGKKLKPHTEETKRKISEKLMGHKVKEETKQKIHIKNKGKPSSRKGKKSGFVPISAFTQGHIPWNKGQKNVYSEEVLIRMKKSIKDFYKTDKGLLLIKKLININKNKKQSLESNIKKSLAMRGRPSKLRGTTQSLEICNKRSESMKKTLALKKEKRNGENTIN